MESSGAKLREKRTDKNRKRKQKSTTDTEQPPKKRRISFSEQEKEPPKVEEEEASKFEQGFPWRNLGLILSIQNKDLDLQKKVELAFDFVQSKGDGDGRDCETVEIPRVLIFLNDWVQSLLIPSGKRIKSDREKSSIQVIETSLDLRCWKIFKLCLEESLKLKISLIFSRNLLQSIGFIAKNTLSQLNNISSYQIGSCFTGDGFELHRTVLDCIILVFSSYGGLSNENLDLWLSTVAAVLELVHKVFAENLDYGIVDVYVVQLSCSVFEPFAKFLRTHPTKKNGFHDFIDKLLEPLLHLLGILRHQTDRGFADGKGNLLKLVEDVLSHGLFHPVHIEGFLSLNSTEKYVSENKKDSKTVIKSYHRHLFAKLEGIVATKKELATCSIGKLFCLLAARVRNLKGALVMPRSTKVLGKTHLEDKRKSLFDFFVLAMEPLLLEVNGYLEHKQGEEPVLLDAHCTLKSINSLLASFMHEKVYLRTEDASEGACVTFLKKVYDMIMSLSSTLIRSSKLDLDDKKQMEMLTLLAEEVVIAVGYLLEIEYNVMGNDLTSLWLMMLSHFTLGISLTNEPERSSLFHKISFLGCQLLDLYSQLRQVNIVVFSFCEAIRLLISHDGDIEVKYTRFLTPLHGEAHAKSVGILVCCQEFKIAVQKAIKSIPEGQASACLQQLITDISESLKWMEVSNVVADGNKFGELDAGSRFYLQAELLGRGLSEVYAMVLNSLTVTTGNSILVGASIKDLITLLCPHMSNLVGLQPDAVNKFLISVTGKSFEDELAGNKSDLLSFRFSTHWVFLFFFQLYMSCRILYREAASLMPPGTSRKMSAAMGDSFTGFSGGDFMQKTDWKNDGYFSSFVEPSASLLIVIQAVSDIYIQDSAADCCPLIYVMHAMTLQRLVDLNRQIKSFEYLLQNNENLVQIRLVDDADLSYYHKKNKKLKRHILILRQEAEGLTGFMMEYLPLVSKNQQPISAFDQTTSKEAYAHESDEWDFGVSSVNKKSLATAIWWILCQNIDIWSIHAAKKKLKMFLSLLIYSSIPNGEKRSFEQVEKHHNHETNQLNRVTMQQISLELFNNSILYEQQFVRRYFASRFCRALEKSVLHFVSNSFANVDFKSSPNWPEVLSDLENSVAIVSRNQNGMYDCFSAAKPVTCSSGKLLTENDKEPKALLLTSMELTASQNLLSLLTWIPKGFFSSRSFSLLLTSILNLERLVIGCLLDCEGTSNSHKGYKLLRLFLCCRKVMKYIIMASCEEKTGASQTSLTQMYPGKSLSVMWLFKSLYAVVGIQELLSKDSGTQVDNTIFSLLDHTLYVFLTLNQYHFNHAVQSVKNPQNSCNEQHNAGVNYEQSDLTGSKRCLSSCSYVEPWNGVFCVAKSLREQMQSLLIPLKDVLCDENVGVLTNVVNLNRFSSVISCFSGFLWGLASVMKQTDVRSSDHKVILSWWKEKSNTEINLCINVFEEFSSLLLGVMLLGDAQCFQKADKNKYLVGAEQEADISCGKQQGGTGDGLTCSASSDSHDDFGTEGVAKKGIQSVGSISAVDFLTAIDSLDHLPLNKPFLRNLLEGDCPEAAFLLRQLLISSSAILRLNLHVKSAHLSANLTQMFTGISQILLSELVDKNVPQPLSFVWLDGVVKYLEELGNHFPVTDPTLSRNLYVKMVELQLRTLGKCIALQGKRATLASHETEASTKLLYGHLGLSQESLPCKPCGVDEFKSRVRLSFTEFIKKPSELHLLSAVQAIERALVGMRERSTVSYDIQTGSPNGGKVSSIVAAALDCLDLVLEFVSGRKRLSVVKRHIQSLIAGVFNIILHLQSPLIFYERLIGDSIPDPGAVILMCVEVLIRISGKHALFQMEAWHVAQSLRIPGALFQYFHQLKLSITPNPVASMQSCGVDRRFTIDLYAACCRLLYNVLKHHKSECEQCIALLEASVSVLLHCLETMDFDSMVRNSYFSLEVDEGVKCAHCLRRIYEEIKHHKDVLGRHCSQFLSTYIWVYSGYGPLKTGIKREIDGALRPGVYALIDACSAEDLQHLHTVFGEGPCRNTLANLQHDYKLNFQYEGKV
ncbi:hypothetical protein L484_003222 [Morus notabilis]|uniref:Nucleolar 27S pre-rRNA processing Urb2/Npa2 C-terminal domain-containing protein n=1 Tax=Morus notabilis TaxID=981085 RepID=W9QGC8_9ROSA|nr:uncharacterized protein LOC21386765 isoform X2 [Morus notabilis]EXB36837.1 hypothetical protein L484_003222 [Morus notabilis]